MQKVILFLKGMCMGFADVVPGVSGGTMAFILGIYVQFVEALKSLNVRWLPAMLRWALSGLKPEGKEEALRHFKAMHLPFLITLGAGIVCAFAIGSVVIPRLMDQFPVAMFAFFIGLILASTIVPFQQMKSRGVVQIGVGLVVAVMTFVGLGAQSEPTVTWSERQLDESLTLEDFNKRFPSIRNAENLYCSNGALEGRAGEYDNAALRAAIAADPEQPGVAANLDTICSELRARSNDVMAWHEYRESLGNLGRKDDNNPFNTAIVPAGTPVHIPQPSYVFIFISGVIGICAMVLPGISGSFLLLIMGVYHFMLSGALKGFVSEAVHGRVPQEQFIYVVIFCAGCLVGILSFARVLSYLFRNHESTTLAAMVGLMLGSLRAIWPFRYGDASVGIVPFLPDTAGPWIQASVALVVGFALVAGMTWLAERLEAQKGGVLPGSE